MSLTLIQRRNNAVYPVGKSGVNCVSHYNTMSHITLITGRYENQLRHIIRSRHIILISYDNDWTLCLKVTGGHQVSGSKTALVCNNDLLTK